MSFFKVSQFLFLLVVSSSAELTGDHVCSRVENYTDTSIESYYEPVVVNTFMWCLQIPPRCPETRTEMRKRHRFKTEVKTRTVKECCEGYKELTIHGNTDATRCVPVCENCLSGVCVSPNECQCDPGYYGDDCAQECPPGFWGIRCLQKCNCDENTTCNHTDGTCSCPPGLRGLNCREACPEDRWGSECANSCNCKNPRNSCNSESGKCDEVSDERASNTYTRNWNEQLLRVLNVTAGYSSEETSALPATASTLEAEVSSYVTFSTSPRSDGRTEIRENDRSTTARPVIVLVSVPERRKNLDKDRLNFAMKDTFLRRIENNRDLRGASPKTDYVKTMHKEDVSAAAPIPLDIALIVVASIISLGLTSIAVFMVLHMRSKLFEAARLTIYEEKTKTQECESANLERISTMSRNAPSQTPLRVNSVFPSNGETSTILTVDSIEQSGYANGPATIGLRISGNLHDLLQTGHYDRPPSTLTRLHANLNETVEHEHVYDEIPLQSTPLCSRKSA